jgi:hypothetical protein
MYIKIGYFMVCIVLSKEELVGRQVDKQLVWQTDLHTSAACSWCALLRICNAHVLLDMVEYGTYVSTCTVNGQ